MIDVSGLSWPDGDDDLTPLEAVLIVKALDGDGTVTLVERITDGLTRWEATGMCVTASDGFRHALLHGDEEA